MTADASALRREATDLFCKLASLKAMAGKGVVDADSARLIAEGEKHVAFMEARALVAELGREHPKALAAIVRAVDLADPKFMDGLFAELASPANAARPS